MSNYKLLLVDDNKQSLKLLKAIYDGEGYDTVTANDGRDAINILQKERIDLIVTDVLMPNIDGYYLCYKVRTSDKWRNIPIIIYTATYTSKSEEKIAMEMGADMFIRKPAAMRVLIEGAKEILANPHERNPNFSRTPESFEMMHQYSSELVTKLEHRNIELEQTADSLEIIVNRFKQAEQIAHLGHWSIDFKSQKSAWSDEAFRIFGIEPGVLEPSQDLFLKYVHPEDQERVRALIAQSMEEFNPFSFSHRIIREGGEIRNLLASCVYEFDKSRSPSRLYGTVLDITDLTEKEKRLEQANKELATFIYKAYHDLRSPIVTILGVVHVASLEIKEERALKYFSMIEGISRKQNKMLMTLVKVMSLRDRTVILEAVDTNKLLSEVLDSLKNTEAFYEFKISVNNELKEPIQTDKELLTDILYNLVSNSLQYRSTKSPEIKITLSKDILNTMLIEVMDNGHGMADKVKEKAFDMFFKGIISKGSGLGLYVVKNAVEKLGGKINLISKENSGSAFQVTIPAK